MRRFAQKLECVKSNQLLYGILLKCKREIYVYMIDKLIDEINETLSHNLYLQPCHWFSLFLTFADEPSILPVGVTKRYISWYNEYIGQYDRCLCDDCKEIQLPYLSGEVV